jgi:trans-aconitate methyltransferase
MSPAEIELMASVEGDHWWYRGLRDVLGRTLRGPRAQIPARANILDAGCGTGENLRFLKDLLDPAYVGGFDLSPVALDHCRAKVPGADFYQSDIRDPEIRADNLGLVLSCDVLSIAGIDDSSVGLSRMVENMRSGGMMILNLPAYSWLRSRHDVATDTRDRVTASQVRRLL